MLYFNSTNGFNKCLLFELFWGIEKIGVKYLVINAIIHTFV